MKLSIALSALLIAGFATAATRPASAIVYCQYVDYPVGCSVRAGVVLRPRPVARAAVTAGGGRAGPPRTVAGRSIALVGAYQVSTVNIAD